MGLPCPILYSSRHSFYNLIQCSSLARGSLVQIATLHSACFNSSPHILSWLLLTLFGRGLPCPNSVSIPLVSKLHLRFFGLHGMGLPCPNCSFSQLILKLNFPSALKHFGRGLSCPNPNASKITFQRFSPSHTPTTPMFQIRHGTSPFDNGYNFFPPGPCVFLFIVRPHPCICSLFCSHPSSPLSHSVCQQPSALILFDVLS